MAERQSRPGADLEPDEREEPQGIAIIGMSGRFPRACNVDELWRNLAAGIDANRPHSAEDRATARLGAEIADHPDYVAGGYYLDGVKLFDAEFFGFSPGEARITDPQHRIFMECVWEALESAGYVSRTQDLRIGLYAGASLSHYLQHNLQPTLEMTRRPTHFLQRLIGNDKDYLATHVSYKLGLRGPSVSVQTACSTSLVALWLACQGLADYQCDLAVAGGVTVKHAARGYLGYIYEEGNILSPDGHCRPFDASAGGTVFGSGAGVVVLKRLEEAIADRDSILAVVLDSAVNNDGAMKVGYTAPSLEGQAEVVALAQAMAGVHPETIGYLEAHGTGTPLGDPVEVAALTQVFRARTEKRGYCALGSIKSNLGHLESAAGAAGLIKTVLALRHRQIPPSLHFDSPNPEIDFASSPFYLNTELAEWKSDGTSPRRAGVSSFGIGGTNAHVILEEAPRIPMPAAGRERPLHLLTLSARNRQALRELAERYVDFLASEPDVASACFTSNTGRRHFDHRLAAVGGGAAQLRERLSAFVAAPESGAGLAAAEVSSAAAPRVAFLLTGQGAQYQGMGRELYRTQPTFRRTLDRCAEILRPRLERDLLEVLYPASGKSPLLHQTAYTQPALFALEVSLAELWKSWGIRPQALLGHSAGEYAAACLAGVFSLEDGLELIAARARLMQALPRGGGMAAVFAGEERIRAAIANRAGEISVAAVNGPRHTVISGPAEALSEALAPLAAGGVRVEKLKVSHAFHSPAMRPMLEDYRRAATRVCYRPPEIPLISNVTGKALEGGMANADYWVSHVRQPVRFAAGVEALNRRGCTAFLEIGPHPVLLAMARQCLPEDAGPWLPSLRRGRPDWQQLLAALGRLYADGAAVDWQGFDRDYPRRRITQPTYPFQRRRFWVDEPERAPRATAGDPGHPLLGRRIRLAGSPEARFEARIDRHRPAFLDHHRVFGHAVLPAAAYVEMALAAGAAVQETGRLALEDLVIRSTLVLPEDGETVLQTVLAPGGPAERRFEIHALDDAGPDAAEPSWTLHASGRVLAADAGPPPADLAALRAEVADPAAVDDHYRLFAEKQVRSGADFQAVRRLWRVPGQSLAEVVLAETLIAEAGAYALHPVLLGACLQAAVAALPESTGRERWLPVAIDRLEVFRRPANRLFSHARVADGDPQRSSIDLNLYDASGEALARLAGLSLRRASSEALLAAGSRPEGWLYEVVWRPQVRAAAAAEPAGSWLIFADPAGLGQELAAALSERGHRPVVIEAGDAFEALGGDAYRLAPEATAELDRLIEQVLGDGAPALRGAVHLWSLGPDEPSLPHPDLQVLRRAQARGCGSVLRLVQSLARLDGIDGVEPPALWLVTRGTRAAGDSPAPLAVGQAPVWGLARVIALERPELRCRCLDLDPERPDGEARELLAELLAPGREDQIAWRGGARRVARLVPGGDRSTLEMPAAEACRLEMPDPGVLENHMARANWRRFLGQAGGATPLLEAFAGETPGGESRFLRQLRKTPPAQRRSAVNDYVEAQVARVLGAGPAEAIGPRQRFFDLGIDSLIAIELRNRLQADLGGSLNQTLIFDHPTLRSLVDFLCREVLELEEAEPEAVADSGTSPEEQELDDLLAEIGQLSESEIKGRFTGSRDRFS